MKAKRYTKINHSTTSGPDIFYKNLQNYYKESGYSLNLTNSWGSKFFVFDNGIKHLEKKFENITKEAMERRSEKVEDYLTSGYIVSEINSSLKAEGVHSSRKIVDQVIKNKKGNNRLAKNEIEKLISNYYEAISFIVKDKEITERNIFAVYLLITADMKKDIIEEGCLYRQGAVAIGEDKGVDYKIVSEKMKELIEFINSDVMEDRIQTKAIIAHYIFENIHPYYDYNGRIGRILHLWILFNKSVDEFWKLIYLSEAVYAYKTKLDSSFRRIVKAKKNQANIDLTYFIANMYEIFIKHSEAYVEMKELTSRIKGKSPTRHLRLFIIDLLCITGEYNKWYTMSDFKALYPDYSPTVYDRVLQEIKDSQLFDLRGQKPIEFILKKA